MITSIKNLFVQAMIAIGIIASPQIIPPQEVISPEPQVIVQYQSVQNTQETKKESPVVNKQKISSEKKIEDVSDIKTEVVTKTKEPEIIIKQVSGQCGNSNNKNITQAPDTNLCSQGETSVITEESGNYKWKCLGIGGGKDANCGASKKQDGVCGSLANTIMPTNYDKEKLCSVGTSSGVSYISNQASWSCSGEYGGGSTKCFGFKEMTEIKTTTTMTTPTVIKTNAVCGSTTYSQYGISQYNLCNSGTASSLKENSTKDKYAWICNSVDGGTNVSCSANYKCVTIYPPVFKMVNLPCK